MNVPFNRSKMIALCFLATLFSSSLTFANVCEWDCCPQQCCEEAPNCAWGYNPSAHQKCGCNPCCGFLDQLSGRVDFFWWRPCSEGLALGYEEVFSESTLGRGTELTSISDSTSVKDLNFKFDPGFRLGIEYYCPEKCWDISLNWTHFHSKAHAEGFSDITDASASGSTLFYSYWERVFFLFPQVSKARWTLDLDTVDLEFGQKFYVNKCFVLRPHFGLRFARIDQNYHVIDFANEHLFVDSFNSVVKSTNDFKGIGPRIGVDIEIDLGCGFALFGKGARSLVFGNYENYSADEVNAAVSPDLFSLDYMSKDRGDRCSVPMSDLSFGLKWEHCVQCCYKYYPVALSVAWEHNAYYDLNHFNFLADLLTAMPPPDTSFSVPGKTGSLTIQGLTVSASIGF